MSRKIAVGDVYLPGDGFLGRRRAFRITQVESDIAHFERINANWEVTSRDFCNTRWLDVRIKDGRLVLKDDV